MRKTVCILLALLVLAFAVQAGEKACPAKRAAEKGYKAIEEFHKVLGPTWHQAWPAKDYDALIAAGPEFARTFKAIAELEMIFKTEVRVNAFEKARTQFAEAVKQYTEACEAGDKEKVYELMPALHEAFEMTASAMLPVHYPQFDGFVVEMNSILGNYLPENDTEAIATSTASLVEMAASLDETTIPEDLKEKQKEILVDLAAIKDLAAKLKECCDNDDMENYRVHIDDLNARVDEFIRKYI
ncbi:MAG: hypothetical protein JSW34_13505 [Candidatus Zixiibacteriota bacterium]|nr:MAG: hypothetical protein JSW34_13505 [candidate division Zixibacteria bacterium]